jgi:hypothetical protein
MLLKTVHYACPYFLAVLYKLQRVPLAPATDSSPVTPLSTGSGAGDVVVTTKLIDYGCARRHSNGGGTMAQNDMSALSGEMLSSRSCHQFLLVLHSAGLRGRAFRRSGRFTSVQNVRK